MRHGEYVPDSGPVIFVANHPNSIMDALVMGLVTKRKVNYIGHAGLFSNPVKSWFLRSCGVIPVYRREDAPTKMGQNESMFVACYEALENGETIGIFPEGTSDMLRKVKQLKTGVARIALETERRNCYALGLKLIPVGLYFFSRSRFRSHVLLNVGAPVDLTPYFEQNKADNHSAVAALTEEIQSHLERLTINIHDEDLDDFVRDIEILYRDELKRDLVGIDENETFSDFFLTQRIAECVEFYSKSEPIKVYDLLERLNQYKRKLKHLRLKDAMLKDRSGYRRMVMTSAVLSLKFLVGLPVALYGILNHIVPYLLTENFAKRFVDERTKILSTLLIGGSLIFTLFYIIQISAIGVVFGKFWAALYSITLPFSGLFVLAYLKEIRREQERLSLSFFLSANRRIYVRMRRERRKLIGELDAIKEDYLGRIRLSSSGMTND